MNHLLNFIQSSYHLDDHEGALYLVPTPIGHLEDMTFRAVHTLKEVDYIACEDTRRTSKLLRHFQVDQRLVSFHEHSPARKHLAIIADLKLGKRIAYVTDAGMPVISDPGSVLVQAALQEQIAVIALPGANAGLTALVGSGITADQFLFYGFLDRNKKKKRTTLEELQYVPYTLIFYEAPHRLQETVHLMADIFGQRQAVLARELSKKFETYIRAPLQQLNEDLKKEDIQGEYCLIVAGHADRQQYVQELTQKEGSPWWEDLSIEQHVRHYEAQGMPTKEALRQTARDRNMTKRDVYHVYHQL